MLVIEIIFYFFTWTFLIYWIHRLCHSIPLLSYFHRQHHKFVANNEIKWKWNNIFLFNDNWPSTIDYWLTEVIPTLLFSFFTGQWWIMIFFYVYAALIQERLEHNNSFNGYPYYTSGKWHILHHTNFPCNFGIGTPFWDWVFNTNKKLQN